MTKLMTMNMGPLTLCLSKSGVTPAGGGIGTTVAARNAAFLVVNSVAAIIARMVTNHRRRVLRISNFVFTWGMLI